MKPLSVFVSIILGIASLGIIVWVGQYNAGGMIKPKAVVLPIPTAEDLPLPKSGPFGKAEIEESSFNFGTKVVGSADKHTFQIKNSGAGVLELKLGKPSCQCTIGEITKVDGAENKQGPFRPGQNVALAPNETVNILVQWVMKSETDKFRQGVPVFTTDPDRREIELVITGVIDGAVHLVPGGLWELGELSQIEPTKAAGFAFSTVLDEFTLTEVPRENSPVRVTWEPADSELLESKKAKSGYSIKVEVGTGVPIGQFRESIKINVEAQKTEEMKEVAEKIASEKSDAGQESAEVKESGLADNGKMEFALNFTVTGHRSGPIDIRGLNFSLTTNRMVFGDFKAAEGKKAKLTLFPKGMTEDLVLKSIEPEGSRLKVNLEEGKMVGNTKSYVLVVEIPPGPAARHRDDNAEVLILKLNHPEAPDLRLLIDYNAKD